MQSIFTPTSFIHNKNPNVGKASAALSGIKEAIKLSLRTIHIKGDSKQTISAIQKDQQGSDWEMQAVTNDINFLLPLLKLGLIIDVRTTLHNGQPPLFNLEAYHSPLFPLSFYLFIVAKNLIYNFIYVLFRTICTFFTCYILMKLTWWEKNIYIFQILCNNWWNTHLSNLQKLKPSHLTSWFKHTNFLKIISSQQSHYYSQIISTHHISS